MPPKGKVESDHRKDQLFPHQSPDERHLLVPTQENAVARFHKAVKSTADFAAPYLAVLAILGGLLGAKVWLDDRIDKAVELKLSDEKILRKIAAESRPALIFNANESVVADMGAVQFVKDIKVMGWTQAFTPSVTNLPNIIHIDFFRHMATAPILTPFFDSVNVTTERGKGLSWDFTIDWWTASERKKTDRLFRLELIP